MIDLRKGDCLKVMKTIPDSSIDAIITDPPYGTTACKWDSVIDFELMWEQLNRIIKPNGAIVLFGSEPFSSALRMSNIKNFKYDWIWDKFAFSNPFTTKYQPSKEHEIISVFYKKHGTYNQQRILRSDKSLKRDPIGSERIIKREGTNIEHTNTKNKNSKVSIDGKRAPRSIIRFSKKEKGMIKDGFKHPTKKPVLLMEYLIKTYTNENETVLDFTMGSGSTGVASKNLNRNFIGIEQDAKYFDIATERIKNT